MNANHRLAMRLLMIGFDGLTLPDHVASGSTRASAG